jgi:nucleoside-diphosphate-sugar epimerase
MKVLVTGASGFIGRALCDRLTETGDVDLVATVRNSADPVPLNGSIKTKELAPDTRWEDVLDSVEVVVHAAARVHVMSGADSTHDYRRINVEGTLNLARQAANCGVKRFVFLSSAKVLGDNTPPGRAFHADDQPAPTDAYATSKHEAEIELARVAERQGMEVVTIRPPLVYGPGVKANFLALLRWVHKGYPLPFARVRNLRSLIALHNLVDLIEVCRTHPAAANETFMAADSEDVSTAELVTRIGVALHKPARLLPVPPTLVLAGATLAGRRDQANRLLGNLQIETQKTRELLGWAPAVSMEQQLEWTARHFLDDLQ